MKRQSPTPNRLTDLPGQPLAAKEAAEVRGGANISIINGTIAQNATEDSGGGAKGKPKSRRT